MEQPVYYFHKKHNYSLQIYRELIAKYGLDQYIQCIEASDPSGFGFMEFIDKMPALIIMNKKRQSDDWGIYKEDIFYDDDIEKIIRSNFSNMIESHYNRNEHRNPSPVRQIPQRALSRNERINAMISGKTPQHLQHRGGANKKETAFLDTVIEGNLHTVRNSAMSDVSSSICQFLKTNGPKDAKGALRQIDVGK